MEMTSLGNSKKTLIIRGRLSEYKFESVTTELCKKYYTPYFKMAANKSFFLFAC